jgi:hypothetical protein
MKNINVTLAGTTASVFFDPTQPTNKIVYKGQTVTMKETKLVLKYKVAGGITVTNVSSGGGGGA